MLATNNLFLLSGRTACRWKYYSYDPFLLGSVLLSLSDLSKILCDYHFGILFLFRKEQIRYFCASIYLILTLSDTTSTIRSPYPLSRVQLSQAPHGLIATFRALLTKLKHNVPGHFRAIHSETRHPGLSFPDFDNQGHPLWYILSRVSSPNFHFSFTRCFKLPGWIFQTLASMTRSNGHMLPLPVLPWPELS